MFKWYLRRLPYYKTEGFSAWELHHAWWGIVLMVGGFVGIFQMWATMFWCQVVIWLGMWWFVDDVIQHHLQRKQICKIGKYDVVTFWHWFPYKLIGRIFMPY